MKNFITGILPIAVILFFTISAAKAQPGSLDNTFSADGKVLTQIGPNYDEGQAIAIQTDGKIVVAGSTSGSSSLTDDFAVVRYLANGTLDATFSGDGKVTTAVGTGDDDAYAVAIQTDGKIVVAGSNFNGTKTSFAIVRYNTDGSLDVTFNGTGKLVSSISTGSDEIYAVQIQTDGKIVVAGNGNGNNFAVARYKSDGTLDLTFNSTGFAIMNFNGGGDFALACALQTDGKIVLAGRADASGIPNFAVARYNTNGTLDNTFSGDGKTTILIGVLEASAWAVAVQGDGKIMLGGLMENGTDYDFALARLNPDGTLDNTFSADGIHSHAVFADDDILSGLKIQYDGKIVASGQVVTSFGYSFALARYNSDGSFDNTFGTLGIVTTTIGGVDDEALGLALQSDGKIVVAGYGDDGTGDYGMAVVRYNAGPGTDIVEENNTISQISLYPNPAKDNLYLDYTISKPCGLEYDLFDMQGRLIFSFHDNELRPEGRHSEQINLQSLPPGIYTLCIKTGSEQVFRIVH